MAGEIREELEFHVRMRAEDYERTGTPPPLAIKQAQKLGYTTGDRETVQLADGYRVRGDTLWQTAREYLGMPQEPEYLQRSTDAYKQAQELYERIPGFPGVATSLRRTRRALEKIDERVVERAAVKDEDATTVWR